MNVGLRGLGKVSVYCLCDALLSCSLLVLSTWSVRELVWVDSHVSLRPTYSLQFSELGVLIPNQCLFWVAFNCVVTSPGREPSEQTACLQLQGNVLQRLSCWPSLSPPPYFFVGNTSPPQPPSLCLPQSWCWITNVVQLVSLADPVCSTLPTLMSTCKVRTLTDSFLDSWIPQTGKMMLFYEH